MVISKIFGCVVVFAAAMALAQVPEALKNLGNGLRASFQLDGIDADGNKAVGITAAGPASGVCSDAVKSVQDANGLGALRFDGKSARVDFGNSAALNFAGDFSISVWIRPEAVDGARSIIVHGQKSDAQAETGLRIAGGAYSFYASRKGSPDSAEVTVPVPAADRAGAVWVHLVGVCKGAEWRLYRNGALAGTAKKEYGGGAIAMEGETWGVGSRGTAGAFFKGDISGLTVWSRALTEEEAGGLFGLGRNGMKVAGTPAIKKALPALRSGAIPEGAPLDLFERFKDKAAWAAGGDAFIKDAGRYGFKFLDAQHTSASSAARQRLSFLGMDVCDARVYFGADGVRRVELSLYNKGDAEKKLDQAAFDGMIAKVRGKLDGALAAGIAGKTQRPRPNYIVQRYQWAKQYPGVQLEWAYVEPHRAAGREVPYSAEYVNVLLVPVTGSGARDNAALTGESMLVKAKTSGQLRTNVRRETGGDVWIDGIPMVDQGQKGYCAAAASERVLRYFGLNVDEHQIAQIAETSAAGGTSLAAMAMAVEKIGRNYQLDKRDLIKIEDGKDFLKSDLMKQIEEYNSVAKKRKKAEAPEINWRNYTRGGAVDIQAIWAAMDPETLLQSRMRQKQAYNAFLKDVKQYVDMGIPVLWSCLVGMYPETPPTGQEGAFGHIRLIIGYNSQTHEIIYSDTWGIAHAKKRMSDAQAWTMTKGMLILKPRL